jgi:hypothetical protein
VRFTNAADVAYARKVLTGKEYGHPHGTIVYGRSDVNQGYSWHLSPVGWSQVSTEVCDGRPCWCRR